MLELSLIGILIGFVSGFFGVGGGMLLVAILIYLNYSIKEAISISIFQMVFSSIYGSFLNFKKAKYLFKDGLILGIGGFIGGFQNSYILNNVSDLFLQYSLIALLLFSIQRIFSSSPINKEKKKEINKFYLFIVGFLIGLISMSLGVGGSIILVPILVSFLKYNLKEATSLGLFFIIFSSLAGFISLSFNGKMLFEEGLILASFSLVGVYFGIKVKNFIGDNSYKKAILFLNFSILIALLIKVF